MKRKIEKILLKEIDDNIPDVKGKILNGIVRENETKKKQHSFHKWSFAISSFACLFIIFTALAISFSPIKQSANGYSVVISINPSIELILDKNKLVSACHGLNEDGVKLLLNEDMVGKTLDGASKDILVLAKKYGYLKDGKTVKINMTDDKNNKVTDGMEEINQKLQAILTSEGLDGVLLAGISETELDSMHDYHEKNGINEYEKNMILQFEEKVLNLLNDKIVASNALVALIEGMTHEEEDVILADDPAIVALYDFSQKYKFSLGDADLTQIKFGELKEISDDIAEKAVEWQEIVLEIEGGRSEDEFEDRLEDILEMAKEDLFEKD